MLIVGRGFCSAANTARVVPPGETTCAIGCPGTGSSPCAKLLVLLGAMAP
jgi:hypothetical protein